MKRTIYTNPQLGDHSPSDHVVFTPQERAARALNVQCQTLEEFALNVLGVAQMRVVPATAAGRILRAACREVFNVQEADSAARGLKFSVQTLLRTGSDLVGLMEADSVRVRDLARVTASYRERLRDNNLVDQSEALWRAAELKPVRRKVYIHGYFRPRVDELAFIDAIAGDGSEFILPCSEYPISSENREAVEFLRQRGWKVDDAASGPLTLGQRLALDFASGQSAEPSVSAWTYPHVEAEVRATLARIKCLLAGGVPPDEIALVARDDAFYGSIVSAIAWEYGLPVRTLYAVPLSETRFGSWLELLLEVILNGLPFEATARLLAQPIGPGLPDRQWAAVRARHPSGLARWQALGIDLSLLTSLPRRETRTKWVEHLRELLDAFETRDRVGLWSREALAFNTLQLELDALTSLPVEILSAEEFAAELKELLGVITVPAQPGSGGIELHTPMSLFGTKHSHLYVMGVAEGMLPATLAEDSVLDFRERHKLAEKGFEFETAADAARREALSFFALMLTATGDVTLSYPRTLQGRETLPSPYLARLGVAAIDAALQTVVASPEELRRVLIRQTSEAGDHVLSHARQAFAVEHERESTNRHNEYDGVTGIPFDANKHVWSVSQLTALGQCPFRWFSQFALKLAEVEEAEDSLSAADRGNLYHKTLEAALKAAVRRTESPHAGVIRGLVLGELDGAFRRVEKEMGLTILPAWDAQREEHLRVLRRAITGTDFIKDDAVVVASEQKFEGEWQGLKVRGVVDRIDRTPGGLILVDYKSGASLSPGPKDSEGKTRLDIQLPLYAHVVSAALFDGEQVAAAYYYSLSKSRVIKRSVGGDPAPIAEFVGRIKTYLQEGRFPVEPDAERTACEYCDYDIACRKGARVERKGGTR